MSSKIGDGRSRFHFSAAPARRRATSRPGAALLGALTLFALSCASGPAGADVLAGGGCDAFAGPGGERSGTVLGFAGLGDEHATVALGALRFDDNLVGDGLGGLGVIAVPFGTGARLRGWGVRYVGHETFRAWRLKAGPELPLGSDRTLGLYFLHDESNVAGVSNGATAELGVPIAARLMGRVSGALASAGDQPGALQGTLGMSWTPRSRLEITADAGLARNGAIGSVTPVRTRGRGLLGLPPLVGTAQEPPSTTSTTRTEGLVSAGIRVHFP